MQWSGKWEYKFNVAPCVIVYTTSQFDFYIYIYIYVADKIHMSYQCKIIIRFCQE
jgi:hypothetical protein